MDQTPLILTTTSTLTKKKGNNNLLTKEKTIAREVPHGAIS